VTSLDGSKLSTHRWPQFLPDGDHFLFLATNHAGPNDFSGIYVGSLSGHSSQGRLLLRTESNAQYASGYLLFVRQSDLMAQPFDPRRLALSGDPVRLTDTVLNDKGIWRGVFSASSNGLLLCARGSNAAQQGQLTWFDEHGTALGTLGERGSNDPQLSPDGHRIALEFGDPNPDIWIFDTVRGVRSRVTTSGSNTSPVWSPDGKTIALQTVPLKAGKGQLAEKAADGTGAERLLYPEDQWQAPTDWSPDGKYIIYDRGDPGVTDIFVLPLAAGQKPFPFVQTPAWERGGVFSPDGHWVAYTSRESGRDEVYVAPFPGPGPRWQVSTIGARTPRWRHDGKALFAVSGDDIVEFPITIASGSLQAGSPKVLFRTAIGQTLLYSAAYDVSSDRRFLINSLGRSRLGNRPLTLVVNWTAGLNH
jgi:hypothetical protein